MEDSGAEEALRNNATSSLLGLSRGDRAARDRLFRLLHADLRAQAAAYLRGERPGHTLQATALVNEAWMRMISQEKVEMESKDHFLALAAQAMRRVLVDHARAKQRKKRGGRWQRLELDSGVVAEDKDKGLDVLAADEALVRLKKRSERLASVVEMRFFGGMTIEEVARIQGVDRATVGRDWRAAKALLSAFMKDQNANEH